MVSASSGIEKTVVADVGSGGGMMGVFFTVVFVAAFFGVDALARRGRFAAADSIAEVL
jgi:16S rRNA G527 N7-methylase RsmG